MDIVVVNVNTTVSLTEQMCRQAQAAALPTTRVLPLTPRFGPTAVESGYQAQIAAAAILDAVAGYPAPFDGLVMGGFGEPGREALQEALAVPVIDITDAATHVACLLGRRFSVVTTVARACGQIQDRLLVSGLAQRCSSVRACDIGVLDLEDEERTRHAVIDQARKAVADDGAEVICLGCAGMAGWAEKLSVELGVPVVDGVTAAVGLLEGLHRLGLSTSKALSYAPTPSQPIVGWPLVPASLVSNTTPEKRNI